MYYFLESLSSFNSFAFLTSLNLGISARAIRNAKEDKVKLRTYKFFFLSQLYILALLFTVRSVVLAQNDFVYYLLTVLGVAVIVFGHKILPMVEK